MEIVLNRRYTRKKIITEMIIVGLLCLLPLMTVGAYAFGGFVSQKLISDVTVAASQLVVGTSTSSSGYITIVQGSTNNTPVLTPILGAGSIVNIYTIVFVLLGILLLTVYVFKGEEHWILRVVIAAVILYLLFYFLAMLQINITNLFGGISGT